MPAFLVSPLDTSVSVTQQDLDSFHAPQIFLVRLLDPGSAGVIALCIISVILYIFPVYLADISQHKSGIGILVLADRAILDIETGKFV